MTLRLNKVEEKWKYCSFTVASRVLILWYDESPDEIRITVIRAEREEEKCIRNLTIRKSGKGRIKLHCGG